MLLKGLKEFGQDLILCSFTALYIRVHAGVVLVAKIYNCENSVSIEVKSFKSSYDDLLSELTQWAFHYSHDLIEVDDSVAIGIERLEQTINIFGVNVYAKIGDCLREFVLVKRARIVVVHNLKTPRETN